MESSPPSGEPGPEGPPGRAIPRFRPGDAVLVAAGLAVAALVALGGGREPSRLIVGSPAGETAFGLPLDTVMTVEGLLGPLKVEVSGRRARIAESPCPGQQCVRTGWIDSAGEASVCAPSAVWIRIDGPGGPQPDAVSY